jgi:hypothetical protein
MWGHSTEMNWASAPVPYRTAPALVRRRVRAFATFERLARGDFVPAGRSHLAPARGAWTFRARAKFTGEPLVLRARIVNSPLRVNWDDPVSVLKNDAFGWVGSSLRVQASGRVLPPSDRLARRTEARSARAVVCSPKRSRQLNSW